MPEELLTDIVGVGVKKRNKWVILLDVAATGFGWRSTEADTVGYSHIKHWESLIAGYD